MDDKSIWKNIGDKKFCAFKMTSRTETFCRNPYNVTGLCNEFSCPLANSQYATVREENGSLYLYMKVPERVHKPSATYEKIELSKDYETALMEIDKYMEYWDYELIHKCKQRLTKLTLYLRRKESLKGSIEMHAIKKKQVRREKAGAIKALNRINFEQNIEKELYKRLEDGIYGIEAKDKFQKKVKVHEFEESDEEFSHVHRRKTKSRLKW